MKNETRSEITYIFFAELLFSCSVLGRIRTNKRSVEFFMCLDHVVLTADVFF